MRVPAAKQAISTSIVPLPASCASANVAAPAVPKFSVFVVPPSVTLSTPPLSAVLPPLTKASVVKSMVWPMTMLATAPPNAPLPSICNVAPLPVPKPMTPETRPPAATSSTPPAIVAPLTRPPELTSNLPPLTVVACAVPRLSTTS